VKISKLDTKKHNRKNFDCGVKSLNNYLKLYANQHYKRDLTRTYVLSSDNKKIVGFYTLTMSIAKVKDSIISVALIGRLGVDKRHQKRGYGEWLLIDALKKLLKASEIVGFSFIIVDAKDGAKEFYKKFGFIEFIDEENKLFITVKKVRNSFKS
jgi:GNAT superfamily N-acetyltransferase